MIRIVYFSVILSLLLTPPVYADGTHPQGIKLDGTIGTAGKIDLPGPDYQIKPEYGKQTGANLFHSFQQFNIHNGESATYSGPASVKNIISRVTGGSASWIDGKLASTIPGADLYFLNPAGVMFGSNASLDLSGSFHVSTADYLKMGDNERFYVKPMADEILSVDAPAAFGFLSDKPAKISVDGTKLRVSEEKKISLIGGDIELNAATFHAPGGRINLASVKSEGEVIPGASGLEVTSQQKSTISLSDKSDLNASGIGGGSIFIRSGEFTAKDSSIRSETLGNKDGEQIDIKSDTISVTDGSVISSSTTGTGKGADIVLQAEKSVTFSGKNDDGESRVVARSGVYQKITGDDLGNGGKINIRASEISFLDGAYLSVSTYGGGRGGEATLDASDILFHDGAYIVASTWGKGKGGNITLKADKTVSFQGEDSNAQASVIQIISASESEGAGDGGNISIEADSISFTKGAFIMSSTLGFGSGGEVFLKAGKTISFDGEDSKATSSRIELVSGYNSKGAGNGGNLSIEADTILFTKGAYINSNTYGTGAGGEVSLKAVKTVSFDGENSKAEPSFIDLSTGYKSEGAGKGGNLNIEADSISFTQGAYISSNTYGTGWGGDIILNAVKTVSFDGENSKATPSLIEVASVYESEGGGEGGNLNIKADNISFTQGAYINSNTYGTGWGGDIVLNAVKTVSLDGENSKAEASRIEVASAYQSEGAGKSGNLTIEADTIFCTKGAYINSNTYGKGKAGDITLLVNDTLNVSGTGSDKVLRSGISADVSSHSTGGNGGNIDIRAKDVKLNDGGSVQVIAFGPGSAGNITIKATGELNIEGAALIGRSSGIYSESAPKQEGITGGNGGRITISAGELILRDGGLISASSIAPEKMKSGSGGDIIVEVTEKTILSGVNPYGETENGFGSGIYARSEGVGNNTGDAGKITLKTGELLIDKGAVIENSSNCDAKGGDIDITARESVLISGDASGIQLKDAAEVQKQYMETFKPAVYNQSESGIYSQSEGRDTGAGQGGAIHLSASSVSLADKGKISTGSHGPGDAGSIDLKVGRLNLNSNTSVSSDAAKSGGGRINIDAKDTVHLTDSSITTNVAQGTGRGGDITIGNPDTGTGSRFVILNRSHIQANAQDGDGGAVFVITDNFLKSFSSIVEASSARGNEGTVRIEAPELDISGALTILPATYFDASRWASTPCEARSSDEPESRFEVRTHIAQPVPFGDLP